MILAVKKENYTLGETPLPRSGHKIVADDKYLYLVGGYVQFNTNRQNEVIGEVWRLHLLTNTWSKLEFNTTEFNCAASHSATKYGNCIFITGGTAVPFGVRILNQLLVINLQKRTQTLLPFLPKDNCVNNMPIATYGHCIVSIDNGNKILMFGGTTGTIYHTQVYCIDLITLESELWYGGNLFQQPTSANNDSNSENSINDNIAPTGRYKHNVFRLDDDSLFLIGGVEGSNCCSLDEIFEFSISKRRYIRKITKGDVPPLLKYPSLCQNQQYVYLTGGIHPELAIINKHIWQLDLLTLTWRLVGFWDRPAYFHDSIYLNHMGAVMMVGGVIQFSPIQKRTMDIYMWSPSTGRKSRCLQELAWEMILRKFQLSKNYSKDSSDQKEIVNYLYNIGVPWSFLSRLNEQFDRISYAA